MADHLPMILVVDDDANTRFMMSEFLDSLGYPFKTVEHGEACLKEVEKDPEAFCLILMDIHMPGLSGVETSVRLRQKLGLPEEVLPIVGISADSRYWESPDPENEFGMNRVMSKPLRLDKLGELIEELGLRPQR